MAVYHHTPKHIYNMSAAVSSRSRKALAKRLLNNWLSRNPQDSYNTGSYDIDDSLGGLNWLQNMDVNEIRNEMLNGNSTEFTEVKFPICPEKRVIVQPPMEKLNFCTDYRDYKNNNSIKPPYSYATLISMAINETKDKKINISSIYKWITDNFSYYKMADSHWKNSIRHNLSLNKRFEKIPREQNESNKGGYWRIKPNADGAEIREGRKRPNNPESYSLLPAKRIKKENDTLSVINSGEDSDGSNGSSHVYYELEDEDADRVCKKDFNWSTILHQDILVEGVRIKTENILEEEEFKMAEQMTSEDVASYPMSSSVPNCDVNSQDLSCFEDLLVFNFNDQPKDQQLNDVALDLTMDVNGDHDWWQKAIDLSQDSNDTSDVTSKCEKPNKEYVSFADAKDIIGPLDNADDDVDICDLFQIQPVF